MTSNLEAKQPSIMPCYYTNAPSPKSAGISVLSEDLTLALTLFPLNNWFEFFGLSENKKSFAKTFTKVPPVIFEPSIPMFTIFFFYLSVLRG